MVNATFCNLSSSPDDNTLLEAKIADQEQFHGFHNFTVPRDWWFGSQTNNREARSP